MDETRQSPERILKQIEKEEQTLNRGHLKIFFGYAAGVGKTYAMLEAAHQALKAGVDVVAGYIEPHTRPETLSLLEASKQEYDGVARLGIEALALKLQGMRVTDIAEIYHVPPSHVGAWISRSAAKLRCDPRFLASLL